MRWKLGGAGLLVVAIGVLFLPWLDLKLAVDVRPTPSTSLPCGPVKLSINTAGGVMELKLDGAPTTEQTYLAELTKRRGRCVPSATPIYITADPSLKYGEFTRLTNGLKGAGYAKLYLRQVSLKSERFLDDFL